MSQQEARVLLVAVVAAIALGALLAWLAEVSWASPGPPVSAPGQPGPAAWEVSQLLEEARKITREATGDDAL